MSKNCYVVRYIHCMRDDAVYELSDHIMGVFDDADLAMAILGDFYYIEWENCVDYLLLQDFPINEKVNRNFGSDTRLYQITEKGLLKIDLSCIDEDDEAYMIISKYGVLDR